MRSKQLIRSVFLFLLTTILMTCAGDDGGVMGPTSTPSSMSSSSASHSFSTRTGDEVSTPSSGEELSCMDLQERFVRFSEPGYVEGNVVGLYYNYVGCPVGDSKLEIFWDEENEPTVAQYIWLAAGEIQRDDDTRCDHTGIVAHVYPNVSEPTEKRVRVHLILIGKTGNCATVRRVVVTPATVEPSPGRPPIAIDIEKATNGEDADFPPGPSLTAGAPVTWTYQVTNTGATPLASVIVTDDQGVAVSCPKTTLGLGESMTCTANGSAFAGPYSNLGTVTAVGSGGVTISDSDPSHYTGVTPGGEGCTPGYWKNHADSWVPTGYAPDQSVQSVFAEASAYAALGTATLMEALDFGGGPGADGAAQILLRAGVAALLNAAHPGVSFPRTPAEVIADVDSALASGNRDVMLALAASLDAANNLGCPLS